MTFLNEIEQIVGPKGLISDPAHMTAYLVEWRDKYVGKARAVILPAGTEEVAAVVRICAKHEITIVPQGGNTSLVGSSIPFESGTEVVLSLSRMNKMRNLDPLNGTLTVDAGCVLANIQAMADDAGFLFPLRIGSEGSCQIGGNISTNAGGVQVLHYGNTRDLVLGLEVVLADGRIWDGLTGLRKDNTGYDLKQLFIGGEGTLGILTGAVLKLFPKPAARQSALVAVPSVEAAVALLAHARDFTGDQITALELIPRIGIDLVVRHVPDFADPMPAHYDWHVLVEISSASGDGVSQLMEDMLAAGLDKGLVLDAVIPASEAQQAHLWKLREEISGAQKPEGGSIKHDISVPISAMADFIASADTEVAKIVPGFRSVAFGHIGDGNVHYNPLQPIHMDKDEFLNKWPEVSRTVHDIAHNMRGSFSAEHGIGRMKVDDMELYKSDVELDMMRKIKTAFDPKGLLNPGKIFRQN